MWKSKAHYHPPCHFFPRCPILYTSHITQILVYLKESTVMAVYGRTVTCRSNTLTSSTEGHLKVGEILERYINICVPIYIQMPDLKEIAAQIFLNYTFAFKTIQSINLPICLSVSVYIGRDRDWRLKQTRNTQFSSYSTAKLCVLYRWKTNKKRALAKESVLSLFLQGVLI